MSRPKYCRNCNEKINPLWQVLLCKDCRRMARWSFAAGSFLVGAIVAVAKSRGWL